MHKALRCTCSQNPPLLSPSFLISFDINITQSLLLDLCLCNPLSLLLGVECNSFCSSVHLFTCITPQIISLSISSVVHHSWLLLFGWWICGSWICCCLILPTFLLPWFLPLPSLSSHSHVCYLWLIVMSIFLHFCSTLTLLIDLSQTNSLFPFSSTL